MRRQFELSGVFFSIVLTSAAVVLLASAHTPHGNVPAIKEENRKELGNKYTFTLVIFLQNALLCLPFKLIFT